MDKKNLYQLAKEIGVSSSLLYHARSGRKNISAEVALKLLKAGVGWETVREMVRKDIRELGDYLISKESK